MFNGDKEAPGNIPLKLGEYLRVLKLTRKPSRDEFSVIAKVAGAGILLVGLIGFVIYLLITVMPGWFK
jgi:protein transport protein SEC61 subunit gamma-like protein